MPALNTALPASLWGTVIEIIIVLFLLRSGLSRAIRDRSEKWLNRKPLQTFFYWVQFSIVIALLSFPVTVYTDFFREHQYGLSNLSFGAWMGEQGKSLAWTLILGGLAVMALYGVARRFPNTSNIWGASVGIAFALSEYRKLDPGKWEEILFFDHPSGRNRIYRSMVWKSEHVSDYTSSQIR